MEVHVNSCLIREEVKLETIKKILNPLFGLGKSFALKTIAIVGDSTGEQVKFIVSKVNDIRYVEDIHGTKLAMISADGTLLNADGSSELTSEDVNKVPGMYKCVGFLATADLAEPVSGVHCTWDDLKTVDFYDDLGIKYSVDQVLIDSHLVTSASQTTTQHQA